MLDIKYVYNNKIDNTFIQIIPEKINITNYSNTKLSKSLTIRNNCNVPLIFHLTPSDSNFILLTDNSIRISPKKSKKISFTISDKLYKTFYKEKLLLKPKKLYIFIKNDLVEEKVEIVLSYYSNDNYNEYPNQINNNIDIDGLDFNFHLIPGGINDINHNNINISPQNYQNHNFLFKNNNNRNYEDVYENNFKQEEKLYQKDYLTKINYLSKMLEKSQRKIKQLQMQKNYFYGKLKKQKSQSFLIKGKKQNKTNYKYQNDILKAKNNKLNNMVIVLQNKLTQYKMELRKQKSDYNFNKNKNYIINNYNYD